MALPKQATGYTFTTELVDQSDTRLFKSTPTLATGDWKISKDQGSFANLNTLPTVAPASTRQVKIVLSATEMTADDVGIEGVDAAGAEWCDVGFHFSLSVRNADDLAFPATSGRSMVVDGSGLVDANAVKVGPTGAGVAQTAGDLFTAVTNIAVTGAALNSIASSATYTTGTSTGGFANTATLDGVFDSVAAAGNAIDAYYQFDLSGTTGAVGVGATWDGYLVGAVNTIKVYAYNWGGAVWDQIGTVNGIAGTVVGSAEYDLTSAHTGTGGNAGLVRIRFAQTGLTTGTLKTDRILLGYVVQPLAASAAPANFGSLAITAAGGVTLADGVTHGGTAALLRLGSGSSTPAFYVTNSTAGHAVSFEALGVGGVAFNLSAFGTALQCGGQYGINLYGTVSGMVMDGDNGLELISGDGVSGGGNCLKMTTVGAGDGVSITTTDGNAIKATSAGSGKHDINLAGSGDILGNLAGTVSGIVLAGRNEVVDAHIGRNIAGGSSTGRTVGQVYAAQRNKIAFDVPSAGQFTVYGVDDTTPLWTGTYTRSNVYNLTGVDPA